MTRRVSHDATSSSGVESTRDGSPPGYSTGSGREKTMSGLQGGGGGGSRARTAWKVCLLGAIAPERLQPLAFSLQPVAFLHPRDELLGPPDAGFDVRQIAGLRLRIRRAAAPAATASTSAGSAALRGRWKLLGN